MYTKARELFSLFRNCLGELLRTVLLNILIDILNFLFPALSDPEECELCGRGTNNNVCKHTVYDGGGDWVIVELTSFYAKIFYTRVAS